MNLNVSLPDELANFLKDKVSTGRYGSSSEVVREALRLMEKTESQEAEKLAWLQQAWKDGVDSGDVGEIDFAALKEGSARSLRGSQARRVSRARFTSQAREDLLDIWRYIATHGSEAVGDRDYDSIVRSCAQLKEYPRLGRVRPEIHADARSLVIERWLAVYRVTNDRAQIVRVVDGARDLSAIGWTPER